MSEAPTQLAQPAGEGRLCLDPADVRLFAAASADVNPMHVSVEYARASPFGAPIAHGMLAALAVLDGLDALDESTGRREQVPGGCGIAELSVDFRTPLLPGVAYPMRALDGRGPFRRIQVRDGERICMTLSIRPKAPTWSHSDRLHVTGSQPRGEPAPAAARPRPSAATWRPEQLREGLVVHGDYGPPGPALAELRDRFPAAARRLGPLRLACRLWSSYLAGMELPGLVALLCRVKLRFPDDVIPLDRAGDNTVDNGQPLRYTARVARVDAQLGMLTLRGALTLGGAPVAAAEIDALTLWPTGGPDPHRLAELLPPSSTLSRRTAVVVGGSRGLGAALALALASQGCTVLVGHRGGADRVAALAESAALAGGAIRSVAGDAADPRWAARVIDELGPDALDLLVCSAAPAPRNLPFEPGALDRFGDFVADTLRLAAAPLAALLPFVRSGHGCCVAVSTVAVQTRPAAWPQYVTAKAAVEGLWGWAAAQHPGVRFLVARPGMLLTDQMNTPMTRDEAGPVEPVAAAIVRDLLTAAPPPGTVGLLRP
jgi:NAD(P)-dependent dehydrogenase (short-subunit alcohol dehydrogenase family)